MPLVSLAVALMVILEPTVNVLELAGLVNVTTGTALTVRVATLLVTILDELLTTHSNFVPLLAVVVAPVV